MKSSSVNLCKTSVDISLLLNSFIKLFPPTPHNNASVCLLNPKGLYFVSILKSGKFSSEKLSTENFVGFLSSSPQMDYANIASATKSRSLAVFVSYKKKKGQFYNQFWYNCIRISRRGERDLELESGRKEAREENLNLGGKTADLK